MTAQKNLYETDFYGWCSGQSEELCAGRIHNLDLLNLSEEIRYLGDSEKKELINALALMFMHLLKWAYQPGRRSGSWENTVAHRRVKIKRILKKSPSLAPHLKDCIQEAYEDAMYLASEETGLDLDKFPKEMPFSYQDAMTDKWMP